jgi:hypothetical protein
MHTASPVLKPAPPLRDLATRCWEEMTQRARDRIASSFCRDWWWAVWEDGKLRIKRQRTGPAGTVFGAGTHSGAAGATLGAPIIECDGEVISTSGVNDADPVLDEAVDTIVELAKLLKERCHQSGWVRVEVNGSSKAIQKLKGRLKKDESAPASYDAEITAVVERSRERRG